MDRYSGEGYREANTTQDLTVTSVWSLLPIKTIGHVERTDSIISAIQECGSPSAVRRFIWLVRPRDYFGVLTWLPFL
jgi:hypothetical protein